MDSVRKILLFEAHDFVLTKLFFQSVLHSNPLIVVIYFFENHRFHQSSYIAMVSSDCSWSYHMFVISV